MFEVVLSAAGGFTASLISCEISVRLASALTPAAPNGCWRPCGPKYCVTLATIETSSRSCARIPSHWAAVKPARGVRRTSSSALVRSSWIDDQFAPVVLVVALADVARRHRRGAQARHRRDRRGTSAPPARVGASIGCPFAVRERREVGCGAWLAMWISSVLTGDCPSLRGGPAIIGS